MPIFAQIVIALVMLAISYLLTPKIKKPKPPEVADLEDPTAEAGRPIPRVFGTVTVKSTNVLWFGEKGKVSR